MLVPFEPQPPVEEVPTTFPSPFQPGPPHPLAVRAAAETQTFIDQHPWLGAELREGATGGKMIGVLVVRAADGALGYLRGYAGMVRGAWELDGFAPPLFETSAFEKIWGRGGEQVSTLDQRIQDLRATASSSTADELQATRHAQRELSRGLLAELQALYRIPSADGRISDLCALFDAAPPPGGAGDCAAPKLVGEAHRMGARPIALAEFWWGAQSPAGGRQHGVYYPACRGRCAKILPFMLAGIACEPAPDVGLRPVPESAPKVVYEDADLIVVDKPCGLLSVPGRGEQRRDSVEWRLQQRCGLADPTWPRLVHRLDLATSGLLIAAKSKAVYVALQRVFSERRVEKRYVALLAGRVESARGEIGLPLRRDLNDRPRQMHDPVHGKAASTEFEVLAHEGDTTRVALYPRTGRTHQLRLHAAHPDGLGAPIVGDLLYGFGGERLMLHAEQLRLAHPTTNDPLELHSPCPF